MSKEEIISVIIEPEPDIRDVDIYEYPYQLFNTVTIKVETTCRKFEFDIYNGYYWNGADIPVILWSIVGSRHNPEFRKPSMLHDFMLQYKKYILKEVLHNEVSASEYRRLTSLIFCKSLVMQGTKLFKAKIMSWCVDVFQHYFNKKEWTK